MILDAQRKVREYAIPRVHVSIRDLSKCTAIFKFLLHKSTPTRRLRDSQLADLSSCVNPFLPPTQSAVHKIGYAIILAVALAYWSRLPNASYVHANRSAYDIRGDFEGWMQRKFVIKLREYGCLTPSDTFATVVSDSYSHLWSYADIPRGIAGTQGLKESFWSLIVAVHTRIPILLTGPPGCGQLPED